LSERFSNIVKKSSKPKAPLREPSRSGGALTGRGYMRGGKRGVNEAAVGSSVPPIALAGHRIYICIASNGSLGLRVRWDDANREHCRKHGVSIAEIEALLSGNPRIAPDLKHARLEDRLVAIGRNRDGRPLFVAFTLREKSGRRLIRPISARYMHVKEIRAYEAQSPADED
jgi:uncharacterized DUF497 family protein